MAVVTKDGCLYLRGGNRYHELVSDMVPEIPNLIRVEVEVNEGVLTTGRLRPVVVEKKSPTFRSRGTIGGDQTPKSQTDLLDKGVVKVEKVWIKQNVAFYKTTRVNIV